MKEKGIISCRIASQLISESFEHKLSLKQQAALKTHLAICQTCRYCLRQLEKLRKVFANYAKAITKHPVPPDAKLSQNARKRMKSALREKC